MLPSAGTPINISGLTTLDELKDYCTREVPEAESDEDYDDDRYRTAYCCKLRHLVVCLM